MEHQNMLSSSSQHHNVIYTWWWGISYQNALSQFFSKMSKWCYWGISQLRLVFDNLSTFIYNLENQSIKLIGIWFIFSQFYWPSIIPIPTIQNEKILNFNSSVWNIVWNIGSWLVWKPNRYLGEVGFSKVVSFFFKDLIFPIDLTRVGCNRIMYFIVWTKG